jgi:predicted signal transduction protein with EAL and GGDEF domain
VHVRCRAEADRLQQDLCADVCAHPELSKPGILLQAIENYRATVGNGAIANPEQVAAATAIHAREASAFTQELMDGRIVAVSQKPMQDGGWVAVHEDITERRRAEAKIAHLARHDMLTNLPNRVLFREHLETPSIASSPAAASPCIASISIISRPSTTRSATRSATSS